MSSDKSQLIHGRHRAHKHHPARSDGEKGDSGGCREPRWAAGQGMAKAHATLNPNLSALFTSVSKTTPQTTALSSSPFLYWSQRTQRP